MKFSANLGFLWTELSLPDAIHAAKAAGFDAVECHWPYDVPPDVVKAALVATGMPMLGLNTSRGDLGQGENGVCALPGRQADARAVIDQAIGYGVAVGAGHIHVTAGRAQGAEAEDTFVANLRYACDAAAPHGIRIVIEPLNHHDAPDYFLRTTDQAVAIMGRVGAENLKLMFDCYHVQRTEGDLSDRLARLIGHIGHIQFASVPDRGRPDRGEVNYDHVFGVIAALGYARPLGAEYRPQGPTEQSLGWLWR